VKYYIIAGEASGDLHGSNLIRQIKLKDNLATFKCWGGDNMQAAAGTLHQHYRDLNFMGFVEVVKNLRTILNFLTNCKEDLLKEKPDALILIDYPGFNLRIAEFAADNNIPVYYYISPQVWAWNSSRVKKIKKLVKKMLVILPFEKAFYEQYDMDVDFVGHPLIDALENWKTNPSFKSENGLDHRPIVALLPGSRKQEIRKMLPLMLSQVQQFPEHQFVVAGAASIDEEFYWRLISNPDVRLVPNQTYDLLNSSQAALVTSGTATLETALFNVPQVVLYKGNPISYQIGKRLVHVKYISLVNLILDRASLIELIQGDCNAEEINTELRSVIFSQSKRNRMKDDYRDLRVALGGPGASERAADVIFRDLMGV